MSQLTTNEKLQLMNEFKLSVLRYLEEQKGIYEDALKAYAPAPIQDSDPEMRRMRENEANKLIDKILELKKHISVIGMMFPFNASVEPTHKPARNAKRNPK